MPAAEFRFTSADCGCAFWIEKRTSACASTRSHFTRGSGEPTTPIGKLLAEQDALACPHGNHVTTAADGSTSTKTLFAIWHADTLCDESFSEFGGVATFHPVGPSLPW